MTSNPCTFLNTSMRIFGDESSSEFKNYAKEPGVFFGSNDVLKGSRQTSQCSTYSFFGNSKYTETVEPKLYLHIPTNAWTTFTGRLREYFLPWRWKAAYLAQENGTELRRILVCTSVEGGKLSHHLSRLIGKSLFLTNLINSRCYNEIFGQEFLSLQGENRREIRISHPLGEMIGLHLEYSDTVFCHIYRPRSLFSTFKYHLLKQFSASWKEVAIKAGQVSENILIKKSDEKAISSLATKYGLRLFV